jgi:hypothetical protein
MCLLPPRLQCAYYGGSKRLLNAGQFLRDYAAQYSRRLMIFILATLRNLKFTHCQCLSCFLTVVQVAGFCTARRSSTSFTKVVTGSYTEAFNSRSHRHTIFSNINFRKKNRVYMSTSSKWSHHFVSRPQFWKSFSSLFTRYMFLDFHSPCFDPDDNMLSKYK